MDRGVLLNLFCNELVTFVHELKTDRGIQFYYAADRAFRELRDKHGVKLSKRFNDETVILELRARPVRVVGKLGAIECDGSVVRLPPKTGRGTYIYACPIGLECA